MNTLKFNYSVKWLRRWKLAVMMALIVLTIIIYISYSHILMKSRNLNEEAILNDKLKQITSKLMILRKHHSKLIFRIKRSPRLSVLIDTEDQFVDEYQEPAEEYESLRRRVYANLKDLWYYLQHQLKKALAENLKPDKIKTILEEVANRKRSLLSDQEKLPSLDGYEAWRRQEAASVGDLVQRRLHHLQHPRDCFSAKKFVCVHEKNGFGWQLRQLVFCLLHAYATKRTVILTQRSKWVYNHKNGWSSIFKPISNTCTRLYNETPIVAPLYSEDKVILFFKPWYWTYLGKGTDYESFNIPKDLMHKIIRFNGEPMSWWLGQVLKYIYKLQIKMKMKIERRVRRMTFKPPIVGVHVRRTDKIVQEAKYHDIDEYMSHVDDYYAQLELTRAVDQRRVYLATDDAKVLEDAIKKYPQYTFYGDYSRAQWAKTNSRYSHASLTGLLVDLHTLTMCDHLVLTLSSNFGRAVYDLMQTNRDASNSITTLDDFYYFATNDRHYRIAVMYHKGGLNEMALNIGDIIDARINHWNGTGYGHCIASNINGLFPWYKTAEYLVSYPFPEYKQVPIYDHLTIAEAATTG